MLGLSLVLESASLVVAVRAVRAGAEQAGLPFMEYVRRGIDPTSVAVMMEDTGAVAGLAVAGASHRLAHLRAHLCCSEGGTSDAIWSRDLRRRHDGGQRRGRPTRFRLHSKLAFLRSLSKVKCTVA